MKKPVVSIIVTTKNEEENIAACLESVKKQTYAPIEIIVVDNNSSDKTKKLARKFTQHIINQGPERSKQRNVGAAKSTGIYLSFIDADMILTPTVISECVDVLQREQCGGVIIPEQSFGTSFWARAKGLERSFYLGNEVLEAARFFDKEKFFISGGFDENITGPEDWDFSQKMKRRFGISRIQSFILHNEGNLSFWETLKKKKYYAKKFAPYLKKSQNESAAEKQFSIPERYWIFLSRPGKLFKNPLLGCGVLIMKTGEFIAGALGFLEGRLFKS